MFFSFEKLGVFLYSDLQGNYRSIHRVQGARDSVASGPCLCAECAWIVKGREVVSYESLAKQMKC
jgi:hypothetical protein